MTDWLKYLGKQWRDETAKMAFRALIAALLIGIAFVGSQVDAADLTWPILSMGVLLAVLVFSTAAVVVFRRRSYRAYWYPRSRHPYEILEKTIEYRVGDDGLLYFSRRVHLRARVDNLASYIDKFVWTGVDDVFPSAGEGCTGTTRILRAGVWTFYSTHFNETLRKGQDHEFVVHWPPMSDWRASSPFVSTSTEEPTRRICMRVEVPVEALKEDFALAEVMRGIESAYPLFPTQRITAEAGTMSWELKPKLYRHYRLRWAWSDGDDLTKMPDHSIEGA